MTTADAADGIHHRNVVLTGFMGTGKTTVGRALAALLDFEFVDTDEVIVERYGPIPQIFADHGEDRFREIEREVAAELSNRDGLVVSTGGRLMLDPANQLTLGRSGLVVALVASAEEIHRRVATAGGVEERPMLAGPDPRRRIEELLAERAEGYARFERVDTEGRSPAEIAADISERRQSS